MIEVAGVGGDRTPGEVRLRPPQSESPLKAADAVKLLRRQANIFLEETLHPTNTQSRVATREVDAQSATVIGQLGWMAGFWQQRVPERNLLIEEQWMTPRARTMFGMSRTVRGDSVVSEFEHLEILERTGRAVYHAEPSRQTPTDSRRA